MVMGMVIGRGMVLGAAGLHGRVGGGGDRRAVRASVAGAPRRRVGGRGRVRRRRRLGGHRHRRRNGRHADYRNTGWWLRGRRQGGCCCGGGRLVAGGGGRGQGVRWWLLRRRRRRHRQVGRRGRRHRRVARPIARGQAGRQRAGELVLPGGRRRREYHTARVRPLRTRYCGSLDVLLVGNGENKCYLQKKVFGSSHKYRRCIMLDM